VSSIRLLQACAASVLAVLSFAPVASAIDEFPAPGNPGGLTAGPDGAIWFTEETGNKIGRMTTGGLLTHEIPVPTSNSLPTEIAVGPDNLIWFTEFNGNKIGRVNPDLSITEFSLSGNPDGITSAHGSLWVTRFGSDQVSRVSTSGSVVNTYSVGNEPGDITPGPPPDDRLWFTQSAGNSIGALSPSGGYTPYPLPNPGSEPSGITASGGALWFTEHLGNRIGRISTTGAISEFPAGSGEPSGIATGSDGAIWFTETAPNKIGRLTPSGTLTNEFAVPTPGSQPGGITSGPDGALWFAEFAANKIGRIAPAPPFIPPPPPPPVTPPATTKKKRCKVPKLRRLTVKKARRKLKRAGCKYKIRGKGRFSSSKPKAGRTTSGTVVVRFKARKRSRR
jgi:virginiamycin B lyase